MKVANKNVSGLRFNEFGEEWKMVNFPDVIIKSNQGVNTTTENVQYSDSGYVVIRSNNISENTIDLGDVRYVDDQTFLNIKEPCKPKRGDILYCNIGSALGSSAIYNSDEKVVINWNVFRIQPNLKIVDNLFLSQNLNRTRRTMRRYATESTMPFISSKVFNRIHFYIPPLPEQQKIASFLSAVDEKIQQLTRKKELLEQYKKGVMQQLFCLHYDSSDSGDGHDDLPNHGNQKNHSKSQFRQLRFKDEYGKAYPKWEEKRLGDVCVINPSSDEIPSSFIYIDLESVVKGHLIQERRIEKTDAPSRAQRKLLPNDILYQTVRPYQMNNYLFNKQGDYVASTGYAQIRTRQDTKYIYQLLHSKDFVNEVMERCTGTSFPAINSKDLGKIKILIPHKEEQQKIANFLSAIDAKIESVAAQIEKTQTFKKGLLQQMFV